MAHVHDPSLSPAEVLHASRTMRAIHRAAVATLVAVGLIVVTAVVAGGALAVVIAMVVVMIPLLVLPLVVIHYDEDETHDDLRLPGGSAHD